MGRKKCFQIINTIKSIGLKLRSTFVCGLVTGLVSLLVLTLSFAHPVGAAPGDLDLSFSGDGKVITDFGGLFDEANAIAIQADGKIVAAGFSNPSGSRDFALARYNSNGTLDTTFSGDGKVATNFGGDFEEARAIVIQADGKIVVAGTHASSGSFSFKFALARYNSNGTLDTTFSGNGKVRTSFGGGTHIAHAMAIQADGKIVVAGFSDASGSFDFALARYNSKGALDTTFSGDGKVTTKFGVRIFNGAQAIAIQTDGKIVVAGGSDASDGFDFALARYNINGILDVTFGVGGRVTTDFSGSTDIAQAMVTQVDGKIVVAGFSNGSGFALARYHAFSCAGLNVTILGTSDNDTLNGTAGINVILGLGGSDTINGLGGNDTICGDTGNDTLNGGYGSDTLRGDVGNDTLNGEAGNDSLEGGAGNDTCNGGSGTDTAAPGCETVISVP